MANWIKNLKVGDNVLVNDNLLPVEKVHKAHVVVAGAKYRKTSGDMANGGRWCISEATPEAFAEIAEKEVRRDLLRRIAAHNHKDFSTGTLQKIVALLDAEKKDGENG